MENKKFLGHPFKTEFLRAYETNVRQRSVANSSEWVVDNLSYDLGQEFTLTGEIAIREKDIDGRACVYLVLPTMCGRELSLQSLMGVSSLNGYDLVNKLKVEYIDNNKRVMRLVQSELINNFNFFDAWQPPTRNYLELASMISDKSLNLSGAKVKYLGVAYKPFVARIGGEYFGERYLAGYKRIKRVRLWSVKMLEKIL